MSAFIRVCAVFVLLAVTIPAAAQTPARRLTTLETVRRFPGYYHLQNVLLHGEFAEEGARIQLRADGQTMPIALADGIRTTSGPVEVRAQFIDVGRLEPTDPRVSSLPGVRDAERWPKPGEELILRVTGVTTVDAPTSTVSLRALSLEPWKFDGQTVTVVGQFRGRNLFGDLPGAPAKTKYDFVIRSGDGSVWITGLRPKGKGFDLDVDARVDTGRWLSITGLVKRERSLVTLEGASLTTTTARAEAVLEEPVVPPPPPSPVEVVFSAPAPDETDVPTSASVRIQFSKGLNPASVAAGFRASYDGNEATPLEFTTSYDLATRSVELRFEQPLTPFKRVRIAVQDSLRGFDGAAVTGWTLTFSAGG